MLITEYYGDAGAPEILTPGDTATSITGTIIKPTATGIHQDMEASAVLITCEDNDVNFTVDGTAPTAKAGTNIGHKIADGQSTVIVGYHNIKNFQCIDRVSGSAGVLKVTPFFGSA